MNRGTQAENSEEKKFMNRILNEIKEIIKKNINEYLPEVKPSDLEENGTVYYMNGKMELNLIGMSMNIYLVLWYFTMMNKILEQRNY